MYEHDLQYLTNVHGFYHECMSSLALVSLSFQFPPIYFLNPAINEVAQAQPL